ncbi:probable L-type lectin-domain containing receptor kinase VII.2 isoform X1 [Vigna radiata var. radiata]|uniref:non-specific serine/threonine protein kinase n=1 Tax=Vigna radiata var. radiata TaxID=3916 RepID=A0A3Q0ETQ5_VIGRR|nr:probable L-type lectin-domain containing receptor kinase VII.2 isoform X1 [Vigna radiata var. radiata]
MSSLALFFLVLNLVLQVLISVSANEFVYNRNFNSSNVKLYGNATIQNSILTLTNKTFFSIGRAFYPQKIKTKPSNSSTVLPFATSFIFSVSPCENFPIAHGFAFLFAPVMAVNGALSGNYLGLFNRSTSGNSSNHVFAVEFDDFRNEEFNEENDNHVGVDLNSIISEYSEPAGFWGGREGEEWEDLKLADGRNYQVWIEFEDSVINVTMAPAGKKKPLRPLISKPINLSWVLLDEMYMGFSGATGRMVDYCRILAWSFSNSNFSIGDALNTKHLPVYVHPKTSLFRSNGFIIGVTFGAFFMGGFCALVFYYSLFKTRREEKQESFEDWELEYWPHRISYQEICDATSGFSEEKVIGIGTSGKVYKGVLKGVVVAVKSINHETQHGMREFLAEISSLGRMKHRNLVGFRGWSKRKGGKLILVYDYMENESLDKRIFECEEEMLLSWEERIRVLQNVADGILYLHEGWEVEVLHRDIKACNVLLDKDMNARLGDFGLARLHRQEHVADTTRVIGTLGYMAPELVRIGRPTAACDVFSFGVLILEVVCGRRPVIADQPPLVDWVVSLMEKGELSCAIDERLKGQIGYNSEEAERMLHLGLLCVGTDPVTRPTMRQVVKTLEGIKCTVCNKECIHLGLLGKINSAASWSKSSTSSSYVNYPTFDEILQTKFYSTASLSVSYPSPQPQSEFVSEGSLTKHTQIYHVGPSTSKYPIYAGQVFKTRHTQVSRVCRTNIQDQAHRLISCV